MSDDPTRIIRRRRDPEDDPERTRIIRHGDEEADPQSEIVSRSGGRGSESTSDPTRLYGGNSDEDAPTRLMGTVAGSGDDKTVLHRRPKPAAAPDAPGASAATGSGIESEILTEEPTVGWLVVVEGPGRGQSLTLSYGKNSIGRTGENRVALPFGDAEVSRTKHAILSFDPRGRKFYVQSGEDSENMAYLNDAPLLTPQPLVGGEHIRLGQTVLQFVPFCGEHFDWD